VRYDSANGRQICTSLRSHLVSTLRLIVVAFAGVAATSCSRESAPPPAAPPLASSGIDLTTFDKTVRSQDDTFMHVNGGWLAKTEIPPDKSSYGAFDILFDKAQADLRAIVEDAAKRADKPPGSDAQKIGDFYESFMDEARADALGLTPVQAELATIDGLQTKADLARYFARMFKLNLINPLTGFADGDARQPDREILYVNQGGLGLPDRDYYLKDEAKLREYREKYVALLTTLLTLAKQPTPEATAKDICGLETRLARAHWTNVESRSGAGFPACREGSGRTHSHRSPRANISSARLASPLTLKNGA
jgi:predicted metalloendopeptidase